MEAHRVGDIMIPLDKYPHVPHWFTLRQTMAVMENSVIERDGRQTLPRLALVFDEVYRLLGVVQRRDILRGLRSRFLGGRATRQRRQLFDVKVDPNLSELSYETQIEAMRESAEQPVSSVMRPIKMTVDHQDHIMKVIAEMIACDQSVIPVLRDNRVVGVVRSVEVFREAAAVVL
jgi:predicted transcriptional regulator